MIKKIISKFKKSKIAKNSMWMIATTIIQMIISLFVNRIVANYLTVSDYGILNYSISFVTFFTSLCTLGLNSIIIKELINNKNKNGELLGTSVVMRLVSSLISIMLIFILIVVLKGNNKPIIICAILQSLALLFDSFNIINLWFQSIYKVKIISIIGLFAYLFVAFYKIYLVLQNKPIYWFAFANSLSAIIIAILLIIAYCYKHGQKLIFSPKTAKYLLKNSYHFIFSGLMVAIYAQTDKIMIGSMIDDISAVGIYAVSTTIINLWYFVPNSIITSYNPTIVAAKQESNELYVKKIKQLYCIILWFSIAYALFITIFSKIIILILYGKKYLSAMTTLSIGVWGVLFSFVGVVREIWLVNEGKQKYSKWFALIGAVVNIILNFIMIPIFGITGAAIATFVTQLIVGLISNLFFKDTRINFKYMLEALIFKFN